MEFVGVWGVFTGVYSHDGNKTQQQGNGLLVGEMHLACFVRLRGVMVVLCGQQQEAKKGRCHYRPIWT